MAAAASGRGAAAQTASIEKYVITENHYYIIITYYHIIITHCYLSKMCNNTDLIRNNT